jgi:hypothetical protein
MLPPYSGQKKKKAVYSSETLEYTYQTTWCDDAED